MKLATEAGVSMGTVQRAEAGKVRTTGANCAAIEAALRRGDDAITDEFQREGS